MVAAAHLRAENYSIAPVKMSEDELAQKAATFKSKEFAAKSVKIATTDAEGKNIEIYRSKFEFRAKNENGLFAHTT